MRKTCFSLLIILLTVQTFAQGTLITPEFLWKLGRVTEHDVSPDGKTVVYVVKHYNLQENKGRSSVYTVAVHGGPAAVISNEKQNPNTVKFVEGGKKLAYLSAESGDMQLWEMNPDGSGAVQLTNVNGGISGYAFSPDGKKIVYAAEVKTQKTLQDMYPDLPLVTGRVTDGLMYRHWDAWEDDLSMHLFLADVVEGSQITTGRDLMTGEPFDATDGTDGVSWSPDGKTIAYTCKKLSGTASATSTNTDIYMYDVGSGKTANLTKGMPGYDKSPQFSPDGKKIAWLSMATPGYESDKTRLMVLEPKIVEWTFEQRDGDIYSELRNDITATFAHSVENFTWGNANTIYFTSTIAATQQVFATGIDAQKPGIKQITTGDHDITSVVLARDGKKLNLVAAKMSISMPTELFLIDAATGMETQLTHVNQVLLGSVQMGKVEKRMVKTTDGKDMLTWVIYPPNFDATKKYPALLYCQGGPQSPVSQFFSYRWNFQLMAANGYIVVAPNRRGLPGFGKEWNDAIVGDYGGQCMRDYLSAIDNVCKETFVNKDKLGAVGASFGGYSVYWLAGNHNKRFKCFIAHCGMFNMESWYGSTEEMFFANHDNQGPYWQQPAPANFAASPHLFVRNWDTPILVIHNEKDFRVPVTQGMEAFTAAQIKGIPSRFLCFPDENHWMLRPQNSVAWQREYFRWLNQWLR